MTPKERFLRMQADRQKHIPSVADSDLVEKFLEEKPDAVFLNDGPGKSIAAEYPVFDTNITISDADAVAYLRELRGQFHAERAEVILKEVKVDVTRSIVGPLGLGKILAAYDKTGGYVDTVHNVREWERESKKGVKSKFYEDTTIVSEEFNQAYDKRGEYDSSTVHKDSRYTKINKKTSQEQKTDAGVTDIYTGKKLKQTNKKDLDHIKSAYETHHDAGRVLAELTTEELANLPENLGPTNRTINQSKNTDSINEYFKKIPQKMSDAEKKIAKLEMKDNLSEKDLNELNNLRNKLARWKTVNSEMAREADQKARKAQNKKINRKYYTSKKFIKNTATAASLEGAKMGLQQAVGLIVIEFLAASFDETKRMIASGTTDWSKLKAALRRIKDRLVDKWQNVLSAFAAGSLSGFLSSLVTTLINAFVTTSKRIVRMIREGFFSFLKAIKTALFPPEGQSYAESFHAASKLLVSGGIIIGGIALEDMIDKALTVSFPVLGLLVTPLVLGIVAGLSALLVAFCCYLLDKMDLFGAVRQEEDRFVHEQLDAKINAEEEKIRLLLG
ncbi:MAG: hypothetical protein OXC62_08415 [Aestuariivita sp.]|nr:hypothetical protein [Aestuariivita sp.]